MALFQSPSQKSKKKDPITENEVKVKSGKKFSVGTLFDADYDWDLEEIADVIYWMRHIFGVILGLVVGLIPLTGSIWAIVFVAICVALPYFYYSSFLGLDVEEMGGQPVAILMEGVLPAVALFLLIWITCHNFPQL